MASPSSFGSPTKATGSVMTRSMRAYQPRSSSRSNALSSDSIGTMWRTGANVADGGAPTSSSGESAVSSSGYSLGERLELAHERVELGVGDLGLVVAVVPLAVVPDLRRRARRRGAATSGGTAAGGRAITRNLPSRV